MSAPIPAKAVGLQWMFKSASMSRVTRAGVRLALDRNGLEFSANDLPDELDHGGQGNCGTIFWTLAKAGIFKAVGFHHEGEWIQKTVKNAGGNHINVYCLGSEALALELLSRHSPCELPPLEPEPVATVQTEML